MHVRYGIVAAFMAFSAVLTHGAAQAPQEAPPHGTQATPPPQGAPQTPAGRGAGRGQKPGVFPAQQRPPADPALVERGRAVYSVTCTACHGGDLRGGQLGGPNLLRSLVVLNDKQGELLLPIVRGSRADKGMPPIDISDEDVRAVAEYIHSVTAQGSVQGGPPKSEAPPPSILVGDARAGEAYFAAKCSSCHSPTGDLQGIATRIPDPKTLQNLWVSGGIAGGRGGRGPSPVGQIRKPVTATVTRPGGEQVTGRLVRIDHFVITLGVDDGTERSFRREGDVPKVEIHDPLEAHKSLLGVYTENDIHNVTAYLVTLK